MMMEKRYYIDKLGGKYTVEVKTLRQVKVSGSKNFSLILEEGEDLNKELSAHVLSILETDADGNVKSED